VIEIQQPANLTSLREDKEILSLLNSLEVADKKGSTDFHALRQAHYFAALNLPTEALKWADVAVNENPTQINTYALRAEIKMLFKNDTQILRSAAGDIEKVQKIIDERKGTKRFVSLVAKLRIRYELAKGDLKGAVDLYEKSAHRLSYVRTKIAREIADAIVDQRVKQPDLVSWANRVLSSK
jgi:hypothetical protein